MDHTLLRRPARIDGARPLAPEALPGTPARPVLETRIRPAARQIEAELRAEQRRQRWRQTARLQLFFLTPRGLRRLVHYVLGAVVVIPLLNLLLTPLTLRDLELQVVLAAAFGVLVAWFRPRGTTVGFLLAAVPLGSLIATGHVRTLPDLLHTVLALLCYFGLGLAVGVVESVVRHGE